MKLKAQQMSTTDRASRVLTRTKRPLRNIRFRLAISFDGSKLSLFLSFSRFILRVMSISLIACTGVIFEALTRGTSAAPITQAMPSKAPSSSMGTFSVKMKPSPTALVTANTAPIESRMLAGAQMRLITSASLPYILIICRFVAPTARIMPICLRRSARFELKELIMPMQDMSASKDAQQHRP